MVDLLVAVTLGVFGCGDDPVAQPELARLGEPCAGNLDCEPALRCNGIELRCVKLCTLDSDECGEGISCEPADDGSVGFCPLPPL